MSQASSVPFAIDTHVTQALSVIEDNVAPQPDSLSIIPIAFSYHSTVPKPKDIKALKNSQIPVFANEVVKTAWVFNGVNNGHSISTMATKNFRADIVLAVAADPSPSGRAVLKQFTSCPVIQDSTKGLLNVIASATTKSSVHCYFFHSRQFELPKTDQAFWLEQVQLIRLLRIKRQLIAFGGFVHPSCNLSFVEKFSRILHRDKWIITQQDVKYCDFGDSIDNSAVFVFGIHKVATENHSKLLITNPPSQAPLQLG